MIVKSFGAPSIKLKKAPSFIESDGSFTTKQTDIANYFYRFFRHDMIATNADTTHVSITDQIMKDKNCNFEFGNVSVEEVHFFIH